MGSLDKLRTRLLSMKDCRLTPKTMGNFLHVHSEAACYERRPLLLISIVCSL